MNAPYLKCLALGTAAMAIAGCAGSDDRYPSLSIRDSERAVGELVPVSAPARIGAEPVDPQSISAALASANDLNTRFKTAQRGAFNLAQSAKTTAPDSDIRSRALVALADLTSLRGSTLGALASLDALEADAATRFAPTAQIEAAQVTISEIIAAQDAAITAIELEIGL